MDCESSRVTSKKTKLTSKNEKKKKINVIGQGGNIKLSLSRSLTAPKQKKKLFITLHFYFNYTLV